MTEFKYRKESNNAKITIEAENEEKSIERLKAHLKEVPLRDSYENWTLENK